MRRLACLIALLAAAPVAAQDFAAESKARSWNIDGEHKARFEARVVDLLCDLTGDCPADCGAGKRQLGLLRSADGVLVLAVKNGQPAFSGAAVDLAPFCGREIEVDGLLIDNPELGARNIYMVQRLREPGGAWRKANRFTRVWARENPGAKGKGGWFRRDPRIRAQIAAHGYLGLGLETDRAFIADWFE